ncbi:MAG TPA: flagellar biosynthesis protein FlhB [Anaerolineae bacterium]|nr:flagellar biosynthesis protein FlhB [Anaerolineae bacterium]HMR63536.1 flagellar biosynthesis protein FlhB [Anaerolineae bacterium]
MSGERTEAATPRRRQQAREKGQIPKSVEVNSAIILLAAFTLLNWLGPSTFQAMRTLMQRTFSALTTEPMTLNMLESGGGAAAVLAAQAIAPFVLSLMVIGVVTNVGQVGLMFSQKALQPDFSRVDPLTGFKRIFAVRSLVELLKSLLKMTIIGLVVYLALRDNYELLSATSRMSPAAGIGLLYQLAITIGLRVAVVMLFLAAADYLYQRWEHERSLKMTKQEVKEEAKESENPQLKGRIRARQREMAMSRMMAAIPQADVVITNPTHLAVALRYERGKMQAPKVIAKGQRLVAERIKSKARELNIPLVENKPLARALFKATEIGQDIPVDLYQAVAEVLAFVYRLKNKNGAKRQGRLQTT